MLKKTRNEDKSLIGFCDKRCGFSANKDACSCRDREEIKFYIENPTLKKEAKQIVADGVVEEKGGKAISQEIKDMLRLNTQVKCNILGNYDVKIK